MVQKKCGLEVSVYIELAQCYREIGNIAESKRVLFLASQVDQSSDNNVLALLKELEYSKSLYLCYKQTNNTISSNNTDYELLQKHSYQ